LDLNKNWKSVDEIENIEDRRKKKCEKNFFFVEKKIEFFEKVSAMEISPPFFRRVFEASMLKKTFRR
jgi:hypothetical protein